MPRTISARVVVACALVASSGAVTGAEVRPKSSDLDPWLEDLVTLKAGLARNYANFEDAVVVRRIDLPKLSASTEETLRAATSDEDRRKALVALVNAFADPHAFAEVIAPRASQISPPPCAREVAERQARKGLRFEQLPSFAALDAVAPAFFSAGTAQLNDKRTIGIIRFPSFVTRHYFPLCNKVAAELGIATTQPCDSDCADKLEGAGGREVGD